MLPSCSLTFGQHPCTPLALSCNSTVPSVQQSHHRMFANLWVAQAALQAAQNRLLASDRSDVSSQADVFLARRAFESCKTNPDINIVTQ